MRAAAAAFLDLGGHGARHHVAARQVLGVRRVALHEALAVLVEQVAALAAHALGDQHAGAGHAGRMELPELHVLERQAGARRHAEAVAGVDEGVGRRAVDAPAAAGGEQGRLRLQDADLAGLHLERRHADARRRPAGRGSGRAPSTRRRTGCWRARSAGRACAAWRGRCGRPRRRRASPSSGCRSSACGRRTGRW